MAVQKECISPRSLRVLEAIAMKHARSEPEHVRTKLLGTLESGVLSALCRTYIAKERFVRFDHCDINERGNSFTFTFSGDGPRVSLTVTPVPGHIGLFDYSIDDPSGVFDHSHGRLHGHRVQGILPVLSIFLHGLTTDLNSHDPIRLAAFEEAFARAMADLRVHEGHLVHDASSIDIASLLTIRHHAEDRKGNNDANWNGSTESRFVKIPSYTSGLGEDGAMFQEATLRLFSRHAETCLLLGFGLMHDEGAWVLRGAGHVGHVQVAEVERRLDGFSKEEISQNLGLCISEIFSRIKDFGQTGQSSHP